MILVIPVENNRLGRVGQIGKKQNLERKEEGKKEIYICCTAIREIRHLCTIIKVTKMVYIK